MLDLTFGEQVKIILSRKGMTIKELAEIVEERTGKKMSRQNLTQRLGRDNFQEQDMRMIADILESPFQLDILGEGQEKAVYHKAPTRESGKVQADSSSMPAIEIVAEEKPAVEGKPAVIQKSLTVKPVREAEAVTSCERDITIGELVEIHEELDALIKGENGDLPPLEAPVEELLEEMAAIEAEGKRSKEERERHKDAEEKKPVGWMSYLQRRKKKPEHSDLKEDEGGETEVAEEAAEEVAETEMVVEAQEIYESYEEVYEQVYEPIYEAADERAGDMNPYTGKEYETNSVRMHPSRIGYVQVYDREEREWTDMTEWAFLGYQERKKTLLGKDYEPPIYLD